MYCFSKSLCFLCLNDYPNENLLNIYKSKPGELRIKEILINTCLLDANISDEIKQICKQCSDTLQSFYNYKKLWNRNIQILKGYIKKMKSNSKVASQLDLEISLLDLKYIKHEAPDDLVEIKIEITEDFPECLENDVKIEGEEYSEVTSAIINDKPSTPSTPSTSNHFQVENNFVCDKCSKSFRNLNTFKHHLFLYNVLDVYNSEDIPRKISYFCRTCLLEIDNIKDVKNHILSHTSEVLMKCNICAREYTCHEMFKKHLNICTKRYLCNICTKRCKSEHELKVHSDIEHKNDELQLKNSDDEGIKSNTCFICNITLRNGEELNAHLDEEHLNLHVQVNSTFWYKCPKCLKLFLTKHELNNHMITCQSVKCHFCKVIRKTEEEFINHIHDVHFTFLKRNVIYKCPKCFLTYLSIIKFNEHCTQCDVEPQLYGKIECLSQPDNPICYFCQLNFPNLIVLRNHLFDSHFPSLDINNDNDFIVCGCYETFNLYTDYTTHKYKCPKSSNLPPYSDKCICNLCNKYLYTTEGLALHLYTKCALKLPYFCKKCSRTFNNPMFLNTHMGSHEMVCDNCKKLFGSLKALNNHFMFNYQCQQLFLKYSE